MSGAYCFGEGGEIFVNLASAGLGARGVWSSDAFFAPLERMLLDAEPVFKPEVYDEHGKWMDGWETRRRRDMGHDAAVICLAACGVVRRVDVDCRHFSGNFAPAASLEGCFVGGEIPADAEVLAALPWRTILPACSLRGDAHNVFDVPSGLPIDTVRLRIYPDGGVARLRVYGLPQLPPGAEGAHDATANMAGLAQGGRLVGWSNAHFGRPWALLSAHPPVNMGDGWETRRRRQPGHEWMMIQLGRAVRPRRIAISTAFYKGNFPPQISLQAAQCADVPATALAAQSLYWPVLLAPTALGPDGEFVFDLDGPTAHPPARDALAYDMPVSHVRLNLHPDGGVSRFHLSGPAA